METTYMPGDRRMDKEDVVHVYNRILCSHQKDAILKKQCHQSHQKDGIKKTGIRHQQSHQKDAIKKKTSAICSNMDGPGDHHTKRRKSERKRQKACDIT